MSNKTNELNHHPLKTTSSNVVVTSDTNSDISTNDLVTSDTYGFAYYPQYYATNMNNPITATNGFNRGNYMANALRSPTISNTASSGAGTGAGAVDGPGADAAGIVGGAGASVTGIQFLATPIYGARLNIVPYEIMPIRVRANTKNDSGRTTNGQAAYDRRGNGPHDKNFMITGNGGGNGYRNGYGNGNANGNANGVRGYGDGYGSNGHGNVGGPFYNDFHSQNSRRYPVF